VIESPAAVRCYYDLDTPVSLAALARREAVPYLPEEGLAAFDLVLSYAGGAALDALQERLGARRVAALYGSVDPDLHHAAPARADFRADLSYLGTYADDRQGALEALFLRVADRLPDRAFLIGGAQYPGSFPWRPNVRFAAHVPPPLHPSFYASSPITLNVTRAPMAALGYCPSARFFEAAACGVPVLSDVWPGVETFFLPGEELLLARDTAEAAEAVCLPRAALTAIGRRARERTLDEHTADHRAAELECMLELARARAPRPKPRGAHRRDERRV
jgi:spore maturation protein CgeB